jgi:gas vesicle protein
MRFLIGFLLGLSVGAVVAMLATPQPGRVMRQVVAYQARQQAQAWRAKRERQAEAL